MRRTEVLVDDLDHPEGVAWDPSSGVLWAGGEAGQLYRVDLERRTWSEETRMPGFVLGLAVDGPGRLAVCCGEALCVYDGDSVGTLRDGFTQPNYAAFAPDGTVYFSDSGHWARDNGLVYRLGVDGALDVFSDGLPHFPNGCAVSPDGRFLWMVESYRPTLSRFDLATGELDQVTQLPGTVPDGVALTVEGGIVVSCYRPDRIVYVDPSGAVETIAEDPQGTLFSAPTNVVFVGPDRDRLVSANLGRWHLTLVDTGLHGVPLHHPAAWAADAHG
jgi:gluconolactonase